MVAQVSGAGPLYRAHRARRGQRRLPRRKREEGAARAGAAEPGRETPQAVGLFDKATGKPLWDAREKQSKKCGPPPFGLESYGGNVFFAANRRLYGLDLATGKELFAEKTDKGLFPHHRKLELRGEVLILSGEHGAEGLSASDGSLVWKHEDFQTAQSFFDRTNKMVARAAASVIASYGAYSPMAETYKSNAKSASSYSGYKMWMSQAYSAERAEAKESAKP